MKQKPNISLFKSETLDAYIIRDGDRTKSYLFSKEQLKELLKVLKETKF